MKQPCAERSESGGSAFGSESARVLTRRLSGPSGEEIERFEGLAALNRNRVGMPSVGMRLTTRVFGIVKGADGARVLRSGRRLWPESCDEKGSQRGGGDRDEWFRIMGGGEFKKNWVKTKGGDSIMDIDDHPAEVPVPAQELPVDRVAVDKMWGLVYSRKRKSLASRSHGHFESEAVSPVKRYGLHFTRRQRRRKNSYKSSFVAIDCGDHNGDLTGQVDLDGSVPGPVLAVLGDSSSIGSSFACFLNHVLRYMKNARVKLSDLYAFLSSEQIGLVYSSHGICFTQELPTAGTSGICKIYRARQFTPMFTVDFSAVPECFMGIHLSMFLRNKCQLSVLVNNSTAVDTSDEMSDDEELPLLALPKRRIPLDSAQADNVVNRAALFLPDLRSSKSGCRAQHRNGINSRSIQKRRSSLRSRRGRNPSTAGPQKPNGPLVSELNSIRKSGALFSSLFGSAKFRRSVRGRSGGNLSEQSSTMVKLPPDVDFSCCAANILVTESDKCLREEGAKVMLEMSSSGEWCLVVKKDGIIRYSHRALNVMRSWTCNRFTHSIIWTGDNDWKLEFSNRQDWSIFKDLYKECSDRNVPLSPNFKTIPVPGVREVPDYEDSNNAAFLRPDSYFKLNNNEVERALAKKTANYDMDSEDEQWLNNFNNEVLVGDGIDEQVSDDNFELMMDAFERALYCSPDDCSDENAAINLCLDMGKREVVEAIYNYWMKKRKLKRSALIRVFQAHQQKRASLSTKSVLRKKRSFKRYPSQSGRGKQPSVLQAIAAEQDALETQKAMQRLEEAKASLERCTEIAMSKRKRAQILMENADLATYKAAMAIRIAEMSRSSYSTDVSCTHFLD